MENHQSLMQKAFKKFVRPFYNLLSSKLFHDLRIQEIHDLLLQINHRVFTVEEELERLKTIQSAGNLMLSGMDTFENPLYQKYPAASLEIYDIAEVLRGRKIEQADIVGFFDRIPVDLKGKTVVVIGGGDNLYAHAAARKGASRVTRIEAASHLSEKNTIGRVQFVYPLDLPKKSHPHCDIVLMPSASWTTLLAPRAFAGLGAYTNQVMILSARVSAHTTFTSSPEPAITDNNGRIAFNDNYLRKQLHLHGFVEVACIYTDGEHIDNMFDQKVSKFNQLKGFYIVSKNTKYIKDPQYNHTQSVEKTYIAYKLPSKNYIS